MIWGKVVLSQLECWCHFLGHQCFVASLKEPNIFSQKISSYTERIFSYKTENDIKVNNPEYICIHIMSSWSCLYWQVYWYIRLEMGQTSHNRKWHNKTVFWWKWSQHNIYTWLIDFLFLKYFISLQMAAQHKHRAPAFATRRYFYWQHSKCSKGMLIFLHTWFFIYFMILFYSTPQAQKWTMAACSAGVTAAWACSSHPVCSQSFQQVFIFLAILFKPI